jgi:hypothetical protein
MIAGIQLDGGSVMLNRLVELSGVQGVITLRFQILDLYISFKFVIVSGKSRRGTKLKKIRT